MSRPALFAVFLCLTLAVAGCGGSGGGSAPRERLSRTAVLDLLKTGLKHSDNITGGDNTPVARKAAKPQTRTHDEESGDFWYSDYYQLWVENVPGLNDDPEAPSGERYWSDHEKTQPAGYSFTWMSTGTSLMKSKFEQTITAGPLMGFYDLSEYTMFEDGSGASSGRGTEPGVVKWSFSGSWNDAGARTFKERADFADGTWQTYGVKTDEQGTEHLTMTCSQGVTYSLHTTMDLQGTGTITGPHEGLPATIAWNEYGSGTITWSDGTTNEFNMYDLG